MLAVGVAIVPHAEQGEIVRRDPLQKLDRFGDFLGWQRRRIGFQFRRHVTRARQHGPPIRNGDAHIGEDFFQRRNDLRPLPVVVETGDMNVNEAFAASFALVRSPERRQPSRLVALDGEDRMDQQSNVERAFADLAEHQVDEERHVVVENFEHSEVVRRARRRESDLGRSGLALEQKRPRLLGERGEFLRAIAIEIVGHRAAIQLGEKIQRNIAPAPGKYGGCRIHKRLFRGILMGAGNVLHGHVFPSRLSRAQFAPILLVQRAHPLP